MATHSSALADARRTEERTRVPALMEAVAIDDFGPPSIMKPRRLPVPKVGPGEVLIALRGAGVGIWDAKIRDGSWATGRERFPLVLGVDGAGIVAVRGARVRRFQAGDRVWAYAYGSPKGGFYAEYVAVKADNIGRVPERLHLLEAGAVPCTGLTALQGVNRLRLEKGATVLIFGGSGAVGTLAIQFARLRQARVLTTASGQDAQALVLRLGADGAIDPRRDDVVEQIRALAPNGLDAVLALAGGDTLERCLGLVRSGGRVAYPNGVEPEPEARRGLRVVSYDGKADPRRFAELKQAVEETRLQVPIAGVYPLGEAAQAHARLEQGHVLGRILLQIGSDPD